SYRSVLDRGFALVRDAANLPVARAEALQPGATVTIEFADGRRRAQVDGARNRRRAEPLVQASLFDN
ncbi:MAG: exodeoxyribonuclease VII large subunit, partial [Methylobacteriaceae bacterium]|nr:exodeoxyribonuclease VII large subunit [Methylobacteriaceae bacterium]